MTNNAIIIKLLLEVDRASADDSLYGHDKNLAHRRDSSRVISRVLEHSRATNTGLSSHFRDAIRAL